MRLTIEPSNGVPIFEQLVRQIKFAVAEGVLAPGQLIPSTRELAKQLAVNPNTVQRAFTLLQGEEILESIRGRGMAVSQGAKRRCASERQQLVGDRLAGVVDEALRSGLAPEQLQDMFEKSLKKYHRGEGRTT